MSGGQVVVDTNKNGAPDAADATYRFRIDGSTAVLQSSSTISPGSGGVAHIYQITASDTEVRLQEIRSTTGFSSFNATDELVTLIMTKAAGSATFNKLEIRSGTPGNTTGTLVQTDGGGLWDAAQGTNHTGASFLGDIPYYPSKSAPTHIRLRLQIPRPPSFNLDTLDVFIPLQDRAIVLTKGGTEIFRLPLDTGGGAPAGQVVPIVLDVVSGAARFTTELSLTNPGSTAAMVDLAYTASLGSKEGSGTVHESVPAGGQIVIADVISHLRGKGLAIPTSGAQGGALVVTTTSGGPAGGVVATARTATDTQSPNPVGRAGLAYGGVSLAQGITGSATVYGLRSTTADRSNLAIFNMSSESVSVKVTAFSGTGDGRTVEVASTASPLTLPAYGWFQYNEILGSNGIESGYVTIERVSTTGSFGAYGIVNDNPTSDGSFVPPVVASASGSRLTLPVLVETSAFKSEMVLANRGTAQATFTLRYVESLSPSSGAGGTVVVQVPAGRQLIIPNAIDYLRSNGATLGASGGSFAGAVRATVSGVPLSSAFIGARTASQASGGGQFGLFTPGVYAGQEGTTAAVVFGLQADADDRTNVAVLHAGDDGSGAITLRLQAFDGSTGQAKGDPLDVTLQPGGWSQPGGFFSGTGVTNGYVKVTRTSGSAPWIAYGVVNDGGAPGQRTGDGAYVAAVLESGGSSLLSAVTAGASFSASGISLASGSLASGLALGFLGLLLAVVVRVARPLLAEA